MKSTVIWTDEGKEHRGRVISGSVTTTVVQSEDLLTFEQGDDCVQIVVEHVPDLIEALMRSPTTKTGIFAFLAGEEVDNSYRLTVGDETTDLTNKQCREVYNWLHNYAAKSERKEKLLRLAQLRGEIKNLQDELGLSD